jgi:hypothetical protein
MIELNGEALTRNTLLTGAIGSGKTSTLNRILSQLIAYRPLEAESKIGLLIFDFKQDGTANRVREWARATGRESDLHVLSADSDTRLELFDDLQGLKDLEETVEGLLSASPPENGENAYWECARRKRLTSALGLYRMVKEGPLYGPETIEFVRNYILSGTTTHSRRSEPPEIKAFEAIVENFPDDCPEHLAMSLLRIEDDITEWRGLDPRTRSNEQSTMTNVLSLLSSHASYDYLGGREKSVVRVSDVVDKGQILVVDIPALRQPELAATLGRWIKSRFYAALSARKLSYDEPGRLAGLIMDEFPLVATAGQSRFSDVSQLQAMRAMRGFAIAATQGIEALNRIISPSETRALIAQFDQYFFFQSKEAAVAELTGSLWGHRYTMQPIENCLPPKQLTGWGTPPPSAPGALEHRPRIGLRELARLEPCQAWVWAPSTQECRSPLWLVPLNTAIHGTPPDASPPEINWEAKVRRRANRADETESREPEREIDPVFKEPLVPPTASDRNDWEHFHPQHPQPTEQKKYDNQD